MTILISDLSELLDYEEIEVMEMVVFLQVSILDFSGIGIFFFLFL